MSIFDVERLQPVSDNSGRFCWEPSLEHRSEMVGAKSVRILLS